MVDGASGSDPADGGVRRRHSAPIDQAAAVLEAQASQDGSSGREQASSSTAQTPTATQPRQRPSGRKSHDLNHHVRFSSDVDRRHSEQELGTGEWHNGSSNAGPTIRAGSPSLTLDTAAAARSSGLLGLGISQSPSSPRSPEQTSSRSMPESPRARSRGYSLRRAVFSRSMQADGSDSVIELDTVGASSSTGDARPISSTTGGKKSNVSVTTTPVLDDELPPRKPDQKKSSIRGVSALPNYEAWVSAKAKQHAYKHKIKQAYEQARKYVLRISEIPPSKDGRHIELDPSRKARLIDERTGQAYVSNLIRSSKYTPWNFLPRQILAQFSKLANFYFLCVSILQMIPNLSTTGTYTTIVPLMFFVSISIGREGYEDLRRSRLDKEENNREASVLHAYQPTGAAELPEDAQASPVTGPKHWASTKWKNVKVGDIVKLERDEAAPADIVLLQSQAENSVAYIETMALDGETNLKSKQAPAPLARLCEDVNNLADSAAHFVVEDPNLDLYNFEGRVTVGGETLPLSNNEVIYRGSILRNTPQALGVVIYTGEECKMRMNANKNPRIKAPTLQSAVNTIVIIIVAFVVALAIFNTIAYEIWQENFEDGAWYLARAGVGFAPIFFSFVIMFNTMIPLSLYVSLEIVKVFQMFLLNDMDMYHEPSNTPMEARTATINEELGQISYIFSDKTGTLTDNSMKFRKMSIGGTAWVHDSDLKAAALEEATKSKSKLTTKKSRKGKKPAHIVSGPIDDRPPLRGSFSTHGHNGNNSPADPGSASPWRSSARPTKAQHELHTTELIRYIQRRPNTKFAQKARFLLLSIALCNTCLPETKQDGTINYQAASPDELALIKAAEELGYIMTDRRSGKITIKTFPRGHDAEPHLEDFEVLDVIDFSSKRKRMSIIVRFPDGQICLITKGADSIITQLLRLSNIAIQKANEIEKRANRRRSVEAQQAIARKSEQLGSPVDKMRSSFSFDRRSFSLGRPSVSNGRKHSLRDQVGNWLSERERDVDVYAADDASIYYTPRPSAQLGRLSGIMSDTRSIAGENEFLDLVDETLVADEPAVIERCFQHVNDFATEGLRTLLYGYRFLGEEEYNKWKSEYNEAKTSLVDRQLKIERIGEIIERDFELCGATAIEDKLQQGVPDAIDKLRRANIKMWMLTGDKRETAINIGHSCRLIKDYSSVTVLDRESGEVEQHLASALVGASSGNVAHSVVVIDGQTLAEVVEDESLKALFFDLAIQTDSVICCRASPSQKAFLVKVIRQKVKKSVTLAIGDGANDIAMIQEAHVGIGITGKEGLQAARTSDYSIAQFRYLTKLLLVHGRWNYIRTCKYTVGTFWKEMFFYLTQALYQRWVGYSGTSLYESWGLSMFNTLFTSLPVIFLGIFTKDLAASTLLAVPELYTKGQRGEGFNFKVYLWWMFLAATESITVFFTMYCLFATGAADSVSPDIFPMGTLSFSAIIIVISIKLQLIETHNISITNAIALVLSCGGWFLWNILLAVIYSNNTIYKVKDSFFQRFGRNVTWWAALGLVILALTMLEIGLRVAKYAIKPSDTDVFQVLEKDPIIRRRFDEASAADMPASSTLATGEAKDVDTAEQREDEIEQILRERGAGVSRNASMAGTHTPSVGGAFSRTVSIAPIPDEDAEQQEHRNSTNSFGPAARQGQSYSDLSPVVQPTRSKSVDLLDLDYRKQAFARYRDL